MLIEELRGPVGTSPHAAPFSIRKTSDSHRWCQACFNKFTDTTQMRQVRVAVAAHSDQFRNNGDSNLFRAGSTDIYANRSVRSAQLLGRYALLFQFLTNGQHLSLRPDHTD